MSCLRDRAACATTDLLFWGHGADCRLPAPGDTLQVVGDLKSGDVWTIKLTHTFTFFGPIQNGTGHVVTAELSGRTK
jgi:hypothetical protein